MSSLPWICYGNRTVKSEENARSQTRPGRSGRVNKNREAKTSTVIRECQKSKSSSMMEIHLSTFFDLPIHPTSFRISSTLSQTLILIQRKQPEVAQKCHFYHGHPLPFGCFNCFHQVTSVVKARSHGKGVDPPAHKELSALWHSSSALKQSPTSRFGPENSSSCRTSQRGQQQIVH